MTTKQVEIALATDDSVSKRNGVFTIRRGYFYAHGRSEHDLEREIIAAIPAAVIVEKVDIWKAFRGGASVANSTHWFVKFTVQNGGPL